MTVPAPAIETPAESLQADATDLLRQLIRNRCVNDGRPDSGGEVRNARLIADYLSGSGVDLELVEPHPTRASLVANLPGRDGPAGGLVLLGHTDVVGANPDEWSVPPFEGALIDDLIWGRGAVDMLGLTTTMAVALRHLALAGFRPRTDLTLLAVADEESGGQLGAGWLAAHRPELLRSRSVVTESGGFPIRTPNGVKLECFVGEKGALAARVIVEGQSGHGAFPYRTENAVLRLAEVLKRLQAYDPPVILDDMWLRYVHRMGLSDAWPAGRSMPDSFAATLAELPVGLARHLHAVTRTTLAPTVVHAGSKRNVIPDQAEVHLDIRVVPGETRDEVEDRVRRLLDGLHHVRVEFSGWRTGTRSELRTPLWESIVTTCDRLMPGAEVVPAITAATTDGRHVRPLGSPCYGFGLFTDRIEADDYFRMFHGRDERIDQQSLVKQCQLWQELAQRLLVG